MKCIWVFTTINEPVEKQPPLWSGGAKKVPHLSRLALIRKKYGHPKLNTFLCKLFFKLTFLIIKITSIKYCVKTIELKENGQWLNIRTDTYNFITYNFYLIKTNKTGNK